MLLLAALAPDSRWLARNDRGNRYEGKTAQNVSAVDLIDLIGFHAYLRRFDPDDDVALHVTFYGDADAAKVRVTAREVVRTEFYWMQIKPYALRRAGGWNDFGVWRVGDVLRPLRIGSDQLAVLARLDGARKIAPVIVRASGEWPRVARYEMHFVTGKRLDGGKYLLMRNGDAIASGTISWKPAHAPFTILLPVGNVPAGSMRLELHCTLAGRAFADVYEFDHQPVVPRF